MIKWYWWAKKEIHLWHKREWKKGWQIRRNVNGIITVKACGWVVTEPIREGWVIGMESGRVRQHATLKSGTMGKLQIRGLVECVGWMWMCMHWAAGCVCQLLSNWAVRPSEKLQKCHAFIKQDRRLGLNGWFRGTRRGSLALLQGIFPTQGLNPGLRHCRQILYQLSHPGSPRILEWVAYPFSSTSPRPRNWTRDFCIASKFLTNWAMREAHSQEH